MPQEYKPLSRGPQLPYKLLAGVEPCRGGWLVATAKLQGISMFPQPAEVIRNFSDVLDYRPEFSVIAVHIPIGLPDAAAAGGRACDRLARKLLGGRRGSAIVSPPPRQAIDDPKVPGLSAIGKALLPRIREVHREVASYHQRTVFEVHPELSFHQLNNDVPLRHPKRTEQGIEERLAILKERVPGLDRVLDNPPAGIRLSTLLDAVADLWTARRIAARAVARLPEAPEWNADGLKMELIR